jgi:putative ABC transport system permease protein
MNLKGFARRFRFTRSVTSAVGKPQYAEILEGSWWKATAGGSSQVSVSEEAAKVLSLHPGSKTMWTIAGKKVEAQVASVYRIDSIHLVSRVDFIFNPEALSGFPLIYYGSVRVQPKAVNAMQQALYQKFPTVTVLNMADVLQTFQGVVDQIATVIRFISAFAILAGAIILSSSVAGTRFRRIREVVILKTLGATRWRVSKIFSVEFLVLGAVAGIMGTLLANAFANVLLKRLLKADLSFDWQPSVAAILLTAFIANAAGWLASFRILGQKPLQVLREE